MSARGEVSHSSLSKSKTLDEIENWEELPGMDQALGIVVSQRLAFRAISVLGRLSFGHPSLWASIAKTLKLQALAKQRKPRSRSSTRPRP